MISELEENSAEVWRFFVPTTVVSHQLSLPIPLPWFLRGSSPPTRLFLSRLMELRLSGQIGLCSFSPRGSTVILHICQPLIDPDSSHGHYQRQSAWTKTSLSARLRLLHPSLGFYFTSVARFSQRGIVTCAHDWICPTFLPPCWWLVWKWGTWRSTCASVSRALTH